MAPKRKCGLSSILKFLGYELLTSFLACVFHLSDLTRNSLQAGTVPKPGKVCSLIMPTALAPCSGMGLRPQAGKDPETLLLIQDRELILRAQWSSVASAWSGQML